MCLSVERIRDRLTSSANTPTKPQPHYRRDRNDLLTNVGVGSCDTRRPNNDRKNVRQVTVMVREMRIWMDLNTVRCA